MPSSLAARMTLSAISPRLAIRILSNIEAISPIARNPRGSIPHRGHSTIISGWSYSTGEPSSTKMLTTLPARGATMSLNVFIASTSSNLSPTFTVDPTSTNGLASGLALRYAVPTIGDFTAPARSAASDSIAGGAMEEPCAGTAAVGAGWAIACAFACTAGSRWRARRTCRSSRLTSISLRSYFDTIFASWSIAATSTRLFIDPSVCTPDGFFILLSSRTGIDAPVNNRAFVYPDDPGKESAPSGRSSCPARPYADVVKRCAAERRDAVVADENVDSPPVKKGGRGPDAFADKDSRLHALG